MLHLALAYIAAGDHSQLSLAIYRCLRDQLRRVVIIQSYIEMPLRTSYCGDWSAQAAVTGTGGASGNHMFPQVHTRTKTADGGISVVWHDKRGSTEVDKVCKDDQPAEPGAEPTKHCLKGETFVSLHWTSGTHLLPWFPLCLWR